MLKYHIIVDFSYLYYKYFFRLKKAEEGHGYMSRLSSVVDGVEEDTTFQYYIGKEIESFRHRILDNIPNSEVVVSLCFDSKSERKEEDSDYKANRHSALGNEDYVNLDKVREFFGEVGYNIYKEDGKEADDLVYSLAKQHKDKFDYTVIYTPDKDVMINIDDKVGVMRSNTFKDTYDYVNVKNYESFLTEKFKCPVPYNSVLLYLSMVGDTVDGISGIKGFGPKAFGKFIGFLRSISYDFTKLASAEEVKGVLTKYKDEYSGKNTEALNQALDSLKMAEYREVEMSEPQREDSDDRRNSIYEKYSMKSLIK